MRRTRMPGALAMYSHCAISQEANVFPSRREFLQGAAAVTAAGIVPEILSATTQTGGAHKEDASPQAVLTLFKQLPGEWAVKIYSPAANGKPDYLVQSA